MNMVASEDHIFTIGILHLLVFGILMLVLIVLSKLFTNSLWKPFYGSLKKLQAFNLSSNKAPTFELTDILEFKQLNETLETLLKQNLQVFKVQKEFAENASHELLVSFKTKLDMMPQTTKLTLEPSVIISQLYEATSRLERINKNLLLLSKIENNQYESKQSFFINDLLIPQIPYLQAQAEGKKIMNTILNDTPLKIEANSNLTEILLNNLLLNAIKHNIVNGVIVISVESHGFTISNSGEPYSLKNEKLYSRFVKVKNSSQGSGQGLAMAKKIIELNGWSINYSYNNDLRTFSIKTKEI
jgi:signal transduction histidine kinase